MVDKYCCFVRIELMKNIFSWFLVATFILGPQILLAQSNLLTQTNDSTATSFDQKAWIDFIRNFYSPRQSSTMFIDRIYPLSGPPGTIVTVTGRGFSKTSNRVYTGYSVIEGLKSWDGRHLNLKIDFLADLMTNATKNAQSSESSRVKAMRIPLWIYTENETGISNSQIFWLSFNPYQS